MTTMTMTTTMSGFEMDEDTGQIKYVVPEEVDHEPHHPSEPQGQVPSQVGRG